MGNLSGLLDIIKNYIKNNKTLVLDSVWVGIVAGTIAVAYRFVITSADLILKNIWDFAQGSPILILCWFVALIVLGLVVGKIIKWEPMISGSGIPQLKAETEGRLDPSWLRVVIGKFIGGFLCILGGLSLGRAGPSIQLGAMSGKGVSRKLNRGIDEEKQLIKCGASAGLAATFNTPFAGVIFSIEQLQNKFSLSIFLPLLVAALVADFISKIVLGSNTIFHFKEGAIMPLQYYWLLLVLGLIIGILGVLNDKATILVKKTFDKITWIKPQYRIIIPFILAGLIGIVLPQILGCGSTLISLITSGNLTLNMLLLLLAAKFIFSIICFGSGAPGGMFFPLLVIGAYIGIVYGTLVVSLLGLDPALVYNFIIIAIAGYFAAVVRTPITAIILIAEMTGSITNVLSITIVAVTSYLIAYLIKHDSIMDSLLKVM